MKKTVPSATLAALSGPRSARCTVQHGRPGAAECQGRREEDRDVHRLPQHPGLPGELSRGLQGADDRRPERQVHRRRARSPTRRASASTRRMRGDRDHAHRPGHGRPRRLLRAARQGRRPPRPRRRAAAGRQSPSCWPRPTARRATARTSAPRSTRAIRRSPASTPTTSTSPSRPTRPTRNPHVGRSNAIMMGMARPYTPAELKAMSEVPGVAAGRAEDRAVARVPLTPAPPDGRAGRCRRPAHRSGSRRYA